MRILIVDSCKNTQELLAIYFKKEGYLVMHCDSSSGVFRKIDEFKPNFIIIDTQIKPKTAFELCKDIRKIVSTPIIFTSEKTESFLRVQALDTGADDFILKPFDIREVVARTKAISRRVYPYKIGLIQYENLVIDKTSYDVIISNKKVDMPPKEMELLFILATHPNKVFTRNELLLKVWGYDHQGDTRTVDVHIKRLREKIENSSQNWRIETVWGVGYKFYLNEKS